MILDGIWDFAWSEDKNSSPVYNDFVTVPDCFDNMQQRFNTRGYAFYRRKVTAGGDLRLKIGSFGLHAQIFWDGKNIAESLNIDFKEIKENNVCDLILWDKETKKCLGRVVAV